MVIWIDSFGNSSSIVALSEGPPAGFLGIFFCLPAAAPGVKKEDPPNTVGDGARAEALKEGGEIEAEEEEEAEEEPQDEEGVAGNLHGVISIPQKDA